jgi:hypothetical protein
MFASGADKFPVIVTFDATFKYCVLMYGIVNVSKKNVAFAAFAVIEPRTSIVPVTWTFVVVTEFETTKFANG